jgi:ClpX C4-type zinc finger/Clp amino terminal domain, pathogenicity island component
MAGDASEVMALAEDEARSLAHHYIGTEHILLGPIGSGGGDAVELRRRIGIAALACSFCGRGGIDVASLAAGPGVYICERCTQDAGQLITSPGDEPAAGPVSLVPDGHDDAVCSFCGKAQADVGRLAASQIALTCGECLALCREIHAGHLN